MNRKNRSGALGKTFRKPIGIKFKSPSLFYFPIFGITILFYSCANIHSLNGGDKDTVPPKDSLYFPLNYGVNFTSSEFSILFDEYIKLNDIQNQLIVSPPLKSKPKVTVKKKTLYLSFDDTLSPNTTYIFNFGKGVVDYTEGNAAKDLSYVFSTGAFLDSLSIKGLCKDALTNEPKEGIKVMLYKDDIDSLPLIKKPFYFGLTDKSGKFSIPYVKKGNYKVFCLDDGNGNFLYDEGEAMGFLDDLAPATFADSLQQQIQIQMSIAEPTLQAIIDQKSDSSGFVVMNFAKKTKELSFEILNLSNAEYITETTEDSTYFWITKSEDKNQIFKLVVADQGVVLDTLYLLYFPMGKSKFDWIPKSKNEAIAVDSAFVLETSSTYFTKLDNSLFSLLEDSIEIPIHPAISSVSNRRVLIQGKFDESKKYNLEILPNAITSLNGQVNDTLRYSFTTNSNSSYGSIVVSLGGEDSLTSNYLLQLLDEKNNLCFQEKIKEKTITISRLEAKKYTLRMVEDNNNNSRWDAGDYLNHVQPEKCVYFPESIAVKPNWVLEYEWNLDQKNQK